MSYKGHYTIINRNKYLGDYTKIRFLSLWEYSFCKFLDNSPSVAKWNSEDIKISYICNTDGKKHLYLVDFYVIMADGKKLLIEIKPFKQTMVPKEPKRKTKGYLIEQFYWVKNQSKWAAAKKFAELNGCEFLIFTENELNKLGIKTI